MLRFDSPRKLLERAEKPSSAAARHIGIGFLYRVFIDKRQLGEIIN